MTMAKPSFVYVTYIATTAEKMWQALIDMSIMRKYWADPIDDDPAHENVSDWKPGSKWEHRRADDTGTVDIVGKVIEVLPPRRLGLTWARPKDAEDDRLICLTVTHENLEHDPKMFEGISNGWPKVLSNLKTLLETGHALPRVSSGS
jgi:uncharacterized protein YndB with AHSA1/START domain